MSLIVTMMVNIRRLDISLLIRNFIDKNIIRVIIERVQVTNIDLMCQLLTGNHLVN